MRILAVGFSNEYTKRLDEELGEYFICIVDHAIDIYDATNFTDFRHYELVIITDEGVNLSIERYVNEVKKKKVIQRSSYLQTILNNNLTSTLWV